MSESVPRQTLKRFIWVVAFGIGFAYVEAAVVVYLREIFYPQGFTFPLPNLLAEYRGMRLYATEVGRELATMVILITSSALIGTNFRTRLAYFLTIFAVWDIFYYVWLKVLLNWPATLMDWDILFLIPLPWAGPVLAPVLISLLMLVIAGALLYRDSPRQTLRISPLYISIIVALCIFVIDLFCRAGLHIVDPDYASYFNWPAFLASMFAVIVLFVYCYFKK